MNRFSCHLVSEEQYFFREFIVSGSWDSSVRIWNRSKSYSLLFPFVCSETAEGAAIKIRFPPAFKATVWIFFFFQDWWQAAIPLHSSAWKVFTMINVHCLPSPPREISGVNISGNRILVTSLAGSLNVIERQGRETFLVKRFFPESQVTQANPSIIEKNTSGSWRNLFPCLWQQFHHDRVKLSAIFISSSFHICNISCFCERSHLFQTWRHTLTNSAFKLWRADDFEVVKVQLFNDYFVISKADGWWPYLRCLQVYGDIIRFCYFHFEVESSVSI